MDEKKQKICDICSVVGYVAILIYIIVAVASARNNGLVVARILVAVIAAISFAIKMVVEIASKEKCRYSIVFFCVCLANIVISSMQLVG